MDVVTVKVAATGPLFDGRAERAVDAGLEVGLDRVAQNAVTAVRRDLAASVEVRTGNAERHVQIERAVTDRVVTFGGLVYGPWLEGTSDRNAATRFKGYAMFRQATQTVDRSSAVIVDRAIGERLAAA